MKQQHHVIYVPGILDDIYHAQGALVGLWRLHGVHGHLHEMPWAGPEPFEPKLRALLGRIDGYAAAGHRVSLVGASAGASAVLNAYAQRREHITSVAYVCAKINALESVSEKTYADNPAFRTSMQVLQETLATLTAADKAKLHSYYSPGDRTVPHAASVIPGVRETRLPPLRHSSAILYALTFGAPKLLKTLK